MAEHELTTVFKSHDVMEAEMIKMALEGEGVPSQLENAHQAGFSGVFDVKVYVRSEDAERAREIIKNLESSGGAEASS